MILLFIGVMVMMVGFCILIHAAQQSINRLRARKLAQQREKELHQARLNAIAASNQ